MISNRVIYYLNLSLKKKCLILFTSCAKKLNLFYFSLSGVMNRLINIFRQYCNVKDTFTRLLSCKKCAIFNSIFIFT